MNSILAKCVSELKKEVPRIDYVLGMLETLMEMQAVPKPSEHSSTVEHRIEIPKVAGASPAAPANEGAMLEAEVRAKTGFLKELEQNQGLDS